MEQEAGQTGIPDAGPELEEKDQKESAQAGQGALGAARWSEHDMVHGLHERFIGAREKVQDLQHHR